MSKASSARTARFSRLLASVVVVLGISLGSIGPGMDFRRGDSNGDGIVDLSDAIFTLGCKFLGQACPACEDAADANDDGSVDISDAVYSLGWNFLGRPPPPDPGPGSCGHDPTLDRLACREYSPCPQASDEPAISVASQADGLLYGGTARDDELHVATSHQGGHLGEGELGNLVVVYSSSRPDVWEGAIGEEDFRIERIQPLLLEGFVGTRQIALVGSGQGQWTGTIGEEEVNICSPSPDVWTGGGAEESALFFFLLR